jgi:hypothetical protein
MVTAGRSQRPTATASTIAVRTSRTIGASPMIQAGPTRAYPHLRVTIRGGRYAVSR